MVWPFDTAALWIITGDSTYDKKIKSCMRGYSKHDRLITLFTCARVTS